MQRRNRKKKTAMEKQLDRAWKGALTKLRRDDAKERAEHLKALRLEQKFIAGRPWWDGKYYWLKAEPGRVLVGDDTGQIGDFQTKEEACRFASRHWELLWRSKEQTRLRDVSKIEFKSQHWWGDGKIFAKFEKDGKIQRRMHVHEMKAALIYEAVRRRREVHQAWLDGEFSFGANGWQHFTGWVVNNLPLSWPELRDLHPIAAHGAIEAMLSPWFVPPMGYSTFPDKSMPEQCEEVSVKLLRLPEKDDPAEAQAFIKYARQFADAGFIFLALDHKTNQSDAYALRAFKKMLARLPHTFRKADLQHVIEIHLPEGTSEAEKQSLRKKERQGTLTRQDFDELWRKHLKPSSDPYGAWTVTETVHTVSTGKRKRGKTLAEEKRFDFPKLFAEIADLDNGKIPKSDFVERVRL